LRNGDFVLFHVSFHSFNRNSNPSQMPRRQAASRRFMFQKTPSAFDPRAERNAFRRRGARLQTRSFDHWNQSLRRSPSSSRLC
jgi:hypothetical protein